MNNTNPSAEQSTNVTRNEQQQTLPTRKSELSTESILQALIENSFDLAGLIDEDFNYRYISDSVNEIFNNKADALFGFAAEQLLGKNCLELVHPGDQQRLAEQLTLLLQGEKKIHLRPYRIRDVNGNWHWLEAIVTNQLSNPSIQAIVVSAREVTQQVEAEQKLKELQFIEALMEGEEKERSRIARDLHDEISGLIAAAKMHFGALSETVPQLQQAKEFLQGMVLLENAALQVRRTSHNLMPEILLENGLEAALQRYCGAVGTDKLKVIFGGIGTINRFSPSFELSLYRIAQELLNNVLKHAGASEVVVQLSQQGNTLSLTIEDNGNGFNPEQVQGGTGLRSIRKRVAMMNGQIELSSAPGRGTSIYLEFTTTTNRFNNNSRIG